MSFQAQTEQQIEEKVAQELTVNGFEKFLCKTLAAPEWMLRKFARKVLQRAGFEIFEDAWQSERVRKDKRYETVHNMLAIRGENPNIALCAHTDVCRDHSNCRSDKAPYGKYDEQYYWIYKGHEHEGTPRKVEPVIKELTDKDGVLRRIITDKENKLQVGGDDRLGVAIALWIALNTTYPMGIALFSDEEQGLISSRAWKMERLKEFDLVAQIDRGNHSDQLVIKIGGDILCDYETTVRLLEIAWKMGKPREVVQGASTDVAALKRNGMVKNAINMTTGYHASIGDSAEEYIDVEEAISTMHFCANIVKDWNENGNTKV